MLPLLITAAIKGPKGLELRRWGEFEGEVREGMKGRIPGKKQGENSPPCREMGDLVTCEEGKKPVDLYCARGKGGMAYHYIT